MGGGTPSRGSGEAKDGGRLGGNWNRFSPINNAQLAGLRFAKQYKDLSLEKDATIVFFRMNVQTIF